MRGAGSTPRRARAARDVGPTPCVAGDRRRERRCRRAGDHLRPEYDSYLFDLIDGPDNWRLITRAPADRGIVLGVVDGTSAVDGPELILWAVGYAASSGGRGESRVGIATAGSLAGISRADARRKIDLLGSVVKLIDRRHVEPIAASLDPRAVDSRSATLGRWTPPPERRPGG